MKRAKIIIGLTILVTILLGAGAVTVVSQEEVSLTWYPSTYSLDDPVPDPWDAGLRTSKGGWKFGIDVSTILLEGIYTPVSTPYYGRRRTVIAPFDGNEVKMCLLAKIPHMAPGEYHVGLEITGLLVDGTPFYGIGYIDVTVPAAPPP